MILNGWMGIFTMTLFRLHLIFMLDHIALLRYNSELWVLHLDELKWSVPALSTSGQAWPSARSGCQVSVHGDTMFVYGGYSKVTNTPLSPIPISISIPLSSSACRVPVWGTGVLQHISYQRVVRLTPGNLLVLSYYQTLSLCCC